MAVFHRYRIKDGYDEKVISPMRAIRLKCMDCSGWQQKEVEKCAAKECPIWCFRMGKNPKANKPAIEVGQDI